MASRSVAKTMKERSDDSPKGMVFIGNELKTISKVGGVFFIFNKIFSASFNLIRMIFHSYLPKVLRITSRLSQYSRSSHLKLHRLYYQ